MGRHPSTFGATGTTLNSGPDFYDPNGTIKTEGPVHTRRILDAGERELGPASPSAPSPEAINLERSFLKLTGDGSSIGSTDDRDDWVLLFFLQYGTLTMIASLALLCGAITAFMGFSPIIPL